MLVIGILICLAFTIIKQTIVHELQDKLRSPLSFKIKSNVSLSKLLSDAIVNSWVQDSPKSAAWKVPHNQHAEKMYVMPKPKANSEYSATNLNGFSHSTKDHFLESLLFSPPPVKVEPDWPVVLGTFQYVDNVNWDDYLIQIEVPYLQRLILSAMEETNTFSRIFKNGRKDTKGCDTKSLRTEFGTSDDFELLSEISNWPFSHEQKFRLYVPTLEHDLDGTDSMNTYFFATPHLLIHHKIKDRWKTISILHYHKEGLNLTSIELNRMVMTQRFFKRVA